MELRLNTNIDLKMYFESTKNDSSAICPAPDAVEGFDKDGSSAHVTVPGCGFDESYVAHATAIVEGVWPNAR